MIARGDSIFHGHVAFGTCFSCHANNGVGGTQGPNLTDAEWLNTDGTMQGIANTISTGISLPKQFPAQMPPMGGADLSHDDLVAVAGYVYSLSHR
jgi:mono/diheme cytochrome c family protein